jgi:RNA polymerase sigma factor (sigma-70 family)
VDPVLRPFIEAEADEDAERHLAALLSDRAAPLVRRIVGRKLAADAGAAGAEDAEDVSSEALLAIVTKLQSLRTERPETGIESFEDYVATVTFHAFAHHLRRRHPERARLKDRLRYALTHDRALALWSTAAGLACGLAGWRPAPPSPDAALRLGTLREDARRWSQWVARACGGPDDARAALRQVLLAAGGPLEFDVVVGALSPCVAATPRADPVGRAGAQGDSPEDALERRRAVHALWREIGALPVRQRVALLLNLRDAAGGGLLWVFPLLGVASLRQIAASLDIAATELADLWNRLPLPDQDIADRLACTRQQVINLRSAARKRLLHRSAAADTPDVSDARGNLGAVSASLKDGA